MTEHSFGASSLPYCYCGQTMRLCTLIGWQEPDGIPEGRQHVSSRGCWCNPCFLIAGGRLVMRESVTLVRTDLLGGGEMLLHVEPSGQKESDGEADDS